MLRLLSQFVEFYGPLRVFASITFRAALALVFSFFFVLLFGPSFIAWLRRQKMTEGESRHGELAGNGEDPKRGTPTMGGILIVLSMATTTCLCCDCRNPLVLLGLFVLLGFAVLGFIDDWAKLKGRGKRGLTKFQKFAGQIILAGLTLYALTYIPSSFATELLLPFTKWSETHPDLGPLGYTLFFLLVLVGASNAVNLTDGLDGLASGVVIMTAVSFVVFSYVVGHRILCEYFRIPHVPLCGELTIYCCALIGAVMGFLWFNAHPAQVFMGDTGSLALGAAIGFVALVTKHEMVLILSGGIFVWEALSVILQVAYFRLTGGKRIFKCSPFHHHLEFSGWHENQVVVRMWLVGAILAALSLMTLKMH